MYEAPINLADAQEAKPGPVEDDLLDHAPVHHPEGFQLPGALWRVMFACYGVFMLSLAFAAGGSTAARFVIVISGLFMLMFFSTATILANLGAPDSEQASAVRPLMTIYGPLGAGEAWIQVLIIPMSLAVYGIAVLMVVSLVRA
jgi:hypothetical protein